MSRAASPVSSVELPDGSRIDRDHKTVDGKRVPVGSWRWVVHDPDRRPSRKRINLRTKNQAAAMRKATKMAADWSLGTLDPWAVGASARVGVPLSAAVERYQAERAHTAAPNTVATDRTYLDRLVAELPGGALVSHVTAAHVAAVVNARKRPPKDRQGRRRGKGPEASPETKKRRRASVQRFLAWALAHGMCRGNPADAVALPKMDGRRRDHLTDDEADAVLRASAAADVLATARGVAGRRGWLADWVTFALGTGLRPGEQAQLRWSAVRLAEGAVEVGRGHRVKTAASRRRVPVAGVALGVLQRLDAERVTEADGLVFTGAKGGPVSDGYLTKRLKALAERVGIEKDVSAYSLRHSYGTRMAAEGVPLIDLAKIMGTSVRMIEKHYAHYDPARGASHVERVFGGSQASVPASEFGHSSDTEAPNVA